MGNSHEEGAISAVMAYAVRKCAMWMCGAFVAMALIFGGVTLWMGYQYSTMIQKIMDAGIEATSQTVRVEQDAKDGGTNTFSGVNVTNKAAE